MRNLRFGVLCASALFLVAADGGCLDLGGVEDDLKDELDDLDDDRNKGGTASCAAACANVTQQCGDDSCSTDCPDLASQVPAACKAEWDVFLRCVASEENLDCESEDPPCPAELEAVSICADEEDPGSGS